MNNSGLSVEELLKLAKSKGNMLEAVENRLPDDKKQELFNIISDKEKVEKLLSSDKAQRLIKKFGQSK